MMIPLSRNLLDGGKNVCIKLQSRLRYIACANACLCSLSTCKKCIHVVTLMMSHALVLTFKNFRTGAFIVKGGFFSQFKEFIVAFSVDSFENTFGGVSQVAHLTA